MALMFAAVVWLLVRDPIDRDQGAVEDRVHQPRCPCDGCGQVVGQGSQQIDGLLHISATRCWSRSGSRPPAGGRCPRYAGGPARATPVVPRPSGTTETG